MDIPLTEFDDESESVVVPHACDLPPGVEMPECCVVTFFQTVVDCMLHKEQLTELMEFKSEHGFRPVYAYDYNGSSVALFSPGVGAPLAAKYLELLIAQGCRYFIVCGACGVLDSSIKMGDFIVPDSAVRDEGTSFHYLKPGREVAPSPFAVKAIEDTLSRHRLSYQITKTWTTDGYYRETRNKIQKRLSEGCKVVEMEASALFAVAKFRGVHIGHMMYGGDDISGEKWDCRGWDKHYTLRDYMIELASEACLKLGDQGAASGF